MRSLRRAAARNAVLVVVAVLALGAAGFLYFRLSPKDSAPSDEYVGFYCPQCKLFFQRSYREFEKEILDKRAYKQDAEAKSMLYKCKKCGQMTAERAEGPPAEGQPAPAGGG